MSAWRPRRALFRLTPARARYSAAAIALPRSAARALPPMSGARGASEPGSSVLSMALPAAGSLDPRGGR